MIVCRMCGLAAFDACTVCGLLAVVCLPCESVLVSSNAGTGLLVDCITSQCWCKYLIISLGQMQFTTCFIYMQRLLTTKSIFADFFPFSPSLSAETWFLRSLFCYYQSHHQTENSERIRHDILFNLIISRKIHILVVAVLYRCFPPWNNVALVKWSDWLLASMLIAISSQPSYKVVMWTFVAGCNDRLVRWWCACGCWLAWEFSR